MPWSDCQLHIKNHNNLGVLISGQAIEGIFTFVIKKEYLILRYIKCKVMGTYKASWSRPMPTMPFIRNNSAKEKVIEITLDIFPEYTGISLTPGILTKEFSFYLPEEIPSSFTGSLGKVKYFIEVEAKVNHDAKKKIKFPITVYQRSPPIENIDSIKVFTDYKLYKYTLLKNKIDIIIKTLKYFTCPQKIPFKVSIVNEEAVKINKVKVALVQMTRYRSKSGYADSEEIICNVEQQIQSKSAQLTSNFNMDVSTSVIPTSNNNIREIDNLMEIKYEFRIEFFFTFHFNLFGKLPVIAL